MLLIIAAAGACPAGENPGSGTAAQALTTGAVRTVADDYDRTAASLEAYQRARSARKSGDVTGAISAYREASMADRNALAPRVAMALALTFRDPSGAVEAWRGAARGLLEDYRSQRWLVRNAIILAALAGSIAAVLLSTGLFLRHLRMIHHTLSETLSWSVSAGRTSSALAWIILAFPAMAGFGMVATSLFYLFLCSGRLRGGERLPALLAAVWAVLLGPALLACTPLWGRAPTGHDATLIAEVQVDPSGRPASAAIEDWRTDSPGEAIPQYLAGRSMLDTGHPEGAIELFNMSRASGEIPVAVLDTNLGNAWAALNRDELAIQHYRRAAAADEHCFEAHYNLSVVLARNGRYVEADRALDKASAIDLDRLRSLGRDGTPLLQEKPPDANMSAGHLWSLDLQTPPRPDPPAVLAALLPLRSLHWGGGLALLAILLALWGDRWFRRLLDVHVCYQCGTPVCRRCLKRVDRRAYCRSCAESLCGLGAGESTRRLIRRLLDERPTWRGQAVRTLTCLVPGTGAVLRGNPAHGALASLLAGLALALWLFPAWGTPYTHLPGPGLWHDLARSAGLATLLLSYAVTMAGTRSAPRRRGSLRAFLDRDVDRMAA